MTTMKVIVIPGRWEENYEHGHDVPEDNNVGFIGVSSSDGCHNDTLIGPDKQLACILMTKIKWPSDQMNKGLMRRSLHSGDLTYILSLQINSHLWHLSLILIN